MTTPISKSPPWWVKKSGTRALSGSVDRAEEPAAKANSPVVSVAASGEVRVDAVGGGGD